MRGHLQGFYKQRQVSFCESERKARLNIREKRSSTLALFYIHCAIAFVSLFNNKTNIRTRRRRSQRCCRRFFQETIGPNNNVITFPQLLSACLLQMRIIRLSFFLYNASWIWFLFIIIKYNYFLELSVGFMKATRMKSYLLIDFLSGYM